MCQETGVTPHHLDEEDALMALRRVAYAVHTLNDGVQRSVIANGRVGAIKVVVDGARQSDAANVIFLGKLHCARERTVAANHHQGADIVGHHIVVGFLAPFFRHECLAAGRFQDRTSRHDDSTDILGREIHNLVVHQTIKATVNTLDLESLTNSCTCHCSDCSIHSRGVAS